MTYRNRLPALFYGLLTATLATQPLAADPTALESPVYFQKTLTQHQVLADHVGASDNQATARWNADGSLTAWWCSSEVFPNSQTHDAIYTATLQPGQSDLAPQPAIHSSGSEVANHDRFDALNVCSPTVVDLPQTGAPDWTLMYYECSPVIFDNDPAINNPGVTEPTGGFIASFVQVCLARLTDQGWKLYNEDLWNSQGIFGDPATTHPTPVVTVSNDFIEDAGLADDNETTVGDFVAPIDGHLYGDPDVLSTLAYYGAGHPAAIAQPVSGGGHELWLYYWNSEIHKTVRLRSTDGINFFDPTPLTINHGTHPKYFPDLEIDGQEGVWVSSSLFQTKRWFEYSLDGIDFEGPAFANPDEAFLFANVKPGYLCPSAGAGSFVGDRLGHVHGTKDFGFISAEGFLGTSDGGQQKGCYHADEDTRRGSTWALYYLEGDFTDVDVVNESCEDGVLGQPQGRVSQGTTIPGWTVDNTSLTGRNWVDKQETGDVFPMAFFNNGLPMDGIHVCFLKQQSAMTQTLDGFTPGREYRVRAWANARNSAVPGGFATPTMRIELGGVAVEPGVVVPAVEAKNSSTKEFRERVSGTTFTPNGTGPYDLVIRQTGTGDATLLIDRVIVEAVPPALVVTNASCEDGAIVGLHGLVDQGTEMPGWQVSDPHLVGRNVEGMAFYNNGQTVDGDEVCLLKQQSSISQLVPGFERGTKYRVKIWANGRNSYPAGVYPTPIMRLMLGGQEIEAGVAVPAIDPWEIHQTPFSLFVASELFVPLSSEPHELIIEQIAAGDATLLIDRVVIEPVASLGGS